MKLKSILAFLALSTLSSQAAISLITQTDTTTGSYDPTANANRIFSNVTVQAGDILVVAQSNNKNVTSNVITMSGLTGNTILSINSGSSGTTSGAWIFYSSITVGGTYNLDFTTSNATKTVSQASSLFVLRPGAGETLAIAATDGSVVASGATSLTLDFTMSPSVTSAYAIAAAAMNTSTFNSDPAGWTQELNGANKRRNYSNSNINGTTLSASFGATAASDMALAGIVVSVVPEPTAALLGSLGLLALLRRRR